MSPAAHTLAFYLVAGAGFYLAAGCSFAAWLRAASAPHERPPEPWAWGLVILVWPMLVGLILASDHNASRRRGRR